MKKSAVLALVAVGLLAGCGSVSTLSPDVSNVSATSIQAESASSVRSLVTKAVTNEFKQFDLNNDGQVTLDEMARFYQQANYPVSQDQLKSMFAKLDTNGDGVITLSEWLAGAQVDESVQMIQQDGPALVQKFGNNGRLTYQEYMAAPLSISVPPNAAPSDVKTELFNEIAGSQDATLTANKLETLIATAMVKGYSWSVMLSN